MEAFFRSLIAVFFIGLIVIGIVLFSIFIIVPTGRLVDSKKGATSTDVAGKDTATNSISNILNSFIPGLVPKGSEQAQTNNNQNQQEQPQQQNPTPQPEAPIVETPQPAPPTQPYQSSPITEKDVPSTAIKITVSVEGFSPNAFTVTPKQKVTLAITSGDEQTHVFKFSDESLSDVAVGLGPKETRAIEFFAPEKSGSYEFYCDVPGHKGRGETGVMTVK